MESIKKRRYCDHCDDYVSKNTYNRHKNEVARKIRMGINDASSSEVGTMLMCNHGYCIIHDIIQITYNYF